MVLSSQLLESLKVALATAGDVRSFCELCYIMAFAYVNRRKNRFRRFVLCDLPALFLRAADDKPVRVTLRINGKKFDVLLPHGVATEFWSIRSIITEVLVHQVYRVDGALLPQIVVDAGANFGLATLFYFSVWPQAHFVCFEPSSQTYAVLVRNLTANGIDFVAIQKAVTNHTGVIRFATNRSSMERAIVVGCDAHPDTEEVACTTLATELRRLAIKQIDLLKFDVEGAEVDLLDGLGDHLSRISQIVGETHGEQLEQAVCQRLVSSGFTVRRQRGHILAQVSHDSSHGFRG